jgi:hypothetical protein
MHETAVSLMIGAAAGLSMALLGGLKDTRYGNEAFSGRVFARSPIVGSLLAAGSLWVGWPYARTASPVVAFLAVIAMERLATETYKLFVRPAPAGRRVPSQAAVFGRPIESPTLRLLLGLLFVLVAATILVVVGRLGMIAPGIAAICFGSCAGGLVAVGGAWKDAPIEGWSTRAFFRSPLVAAFVAAVIPLATDSQAAAVGGPTNAITLFFVCLGGERLLVESYKAFIRRRRPSKFFEPTDPPEVAPPGNRPKVLGGTWAGPAFVASYCSAVGIAGIALVLSLA